VSQVVGKSRWQIWWNRFRVRLPVLLLLALLLWADPAWRFAGAPFLLFGQGLRTWAVGYLHKDRQLATSGPYAFCRHPLYLGTLLSCIGVSALVGNWLVGLVFVAIYIVVYIPTMRQEEGYLERVYGSSFQEYVAQVPAFLPRLRPAVLGEPRRWAWSRLIANEEHLTWAALVIFLLAMAARQRFT